MLHEILFKDTKTGATIVSFGSGRVALKISGTWNKYYIDLYKNHGCTFVWIQSRDGSDSLENVIREQLSNELQLMGRFTNLHLVEQADFLRTLTLQLTTRSTLNLSNLRLESLRTSAAHIKLISRLPKPLRYLMLSEYNEADFHSLSYLAQLEGLELGPARKLASFEGLSKLTEITTLAVWYAPHLFNIAELRACKKLEELKFNHCKAIGSVEVLGGITSLKKIHLNNCGIIKSLRPLGHLNRVEEILFTEDTIITDGAIRQLASISSLQTVLFKNRRHYDIARENLLERS